MAQIKYGTKKIRFEIKRGRRKKTVALQIRPNTVVVVLSPYFLGVDKIKEIVIKRARWILEKQEKLRRINARLPKKEFVSGESFPYLGREYRLKVLRTDSKKSLPCRLINGRLYVQINDKLPGKAAANHIKKKLIEWYTERAKEKIAERVKIYYRLTGKRPKKIIIKNQEKRWGSCSHSGVIRFNWKIIMAPISVLDYVIVHELCHLIYPSHSKEFWQKLESIMDNYKNKRNWLKENNILLSYSFDTGIS